MELLSGLGLRGFRSFYGDLQVVSPLTKINLIAGQNNSGKSNVLRFAHELSQLRSTAPAGFDTPRISSERPTFELALRLGDRESILEKFRSDNIASDIIESLRRILADSAIDLRGDNSVWIRWAQESVGDENVSLRP